MSFKKEFTKGLWKDIAPFRLVLGLCPTLGVTTTFKNGVGMGLATTFVLVCSNVIISLLRKNVKKEVRVAAFIVVIATFTTIVKILMEAFAYPLYEALGIFIPLIVVNCIILGRAEAFASKNGPSDSLADGLGIGLGFTMSLGVLGAVRELFGAGTLFSGLALGETSFEIALLSQPMAFMQQPPGAFVCLGLLLGIMNVLGRRRSAEGQG